MTTTIIFYRTFDDNIPIVDWIISDRLLTHIEKFSRFTWWNYHVHAHCQTIIKAFHYTSIDVTVDYKLPYSQRYKLCDDICRFLETLPPHKPLPVINESTYPEFYI